MKTYQEKELLKLSKADLYAIARERQIPGRSALSKQELIDAILDRKSTSSPEQPKRPAAGKQTPATTSRTPSPVAERTTATPAAGGRRGLRGSARPAPMEEAFALSRPPKKPRSSATGMPHEGRLSGHEHECGLPAAYGDNRLVLQTRDPYWAHAYWETGAQRRRELQQQLGLDRYQRSQIILRVYDITGIVFDGANAHRFVDVPVYEETGNWHLHLNRPDGSFIADLGLVSPDGQFHLITRSNAIRLPRGTPSDVIDPDWEVSDENYQRMYKLSGGNTPSGSSFHGAAIPGTSKEPDRGESR
ncbi:MAG TPA: DUF4912 domain-containing protein [Candidatus Ozemobacteraceae bacterium]|nr:DUF4912 domain-containing protein [Candidatus Ozemobacteraceae bacterium]